MMINWMFETLSIHFLVLVTAATPVIEIWGAIPVGIANGLTVQETYFLALFGSMLPVPVILLCLRPFFKVARKLTWMERIEHRLIEKAKRDGDLIRKYDFWGLVIFVAVPFPGTGVWTGSLIAALIDMRIKRALLAILIGNLISIAGMLLLSSGIIQLI